MISIVIPVYNEEKQIRETVRVIAGILADSQINYEFIFIDDGSKDHTWRELKQLAAVDPKIKAIRLSRNFGKEAALCAGLNAIQGDACIVMDADLQHPPALIPEMVRLWKDDGYEIVEGVKSSRGKESWSSRLSAGLFYRILHKLSGINLKDASDFKLLDARVVSAWQAMPERNTFFRGMAAWVGFKRIAVPFEVAERTTGGTKWSKYRLFKLAITAITSFSSFPLQIVTFLGFLFLLGSVLLGIQTIYMKFSGIAVDGFTTVILLLLITGSALMISLGIIGTYLAKIFEEVKHRPRYIVAETVNGTKGGIEHRV
ncbi:MAG: glycosyltransferase family 2 protein [Firmicutes bacterium]|nr:glycosyltransferase family 2 protein [Bacillota bacterium]